ncbi:arginine N-succinyltransferase [Saccharospirillum sp. MSK14-1]|uniref:arginine N-succinyltransferase n=1 Tax=Saccharospirillum sp. MSK14-1 TaxID=1897632 RepID=UPI000D35A368|nr:arginine N-succinyltransferase [Saccharospirillum sp. MSK14-1]PTY38139.1 arginine N-succinyltransferase [Saccharospirillum sp. MSK14-1]
MYIRPVTPADIEYLYLMAKNSGIGVTTLPDNRQKMQAKLDKAVASFKRDLEEKDRLYLFAMIDSDSDEIAGICALEASIGHDDIWYNYHVGKTVHMSKDIGVHKITRTLYLSNDLTGSSEICTLFLMPNFRKNQNGQLLSKSRYLFLAEHPQLFGRDIIAEMRGYSDEEGRSPFWESLGRHFFQMEFSDADYLTGLGDKAFIAELMPKFPIYVPMLSADAQEAFGRVHPDTEPALAMLQAEGFDFNGYIDIFDGGPTVSAKIKEIRAVRDSKLYSVKIDDQAPLPDLTRKDGLTLVSNRGFDNFRVCLVATNAINESTLHLSAAQAATLQVADGDSVRAVTLRPETTHV